MQGLGYAAIPRGELEGSHHRVRKARGACFQEATASVVPWRWRAGKLETRVGSQDLLYGCGVDGENKPADAFTSVCKAGAERWGSN